MVAFLKRLYFIHLTVFTLLTNHFTTPLGSASQIGVQGNPLLTAFAPSVHFWDTRPETRIQEASASLGLRICSVLATQVTWVRGQQLACIQLGLQTFRNSFQY